jgi:uncharacterized repeat protein (TIGR02543 family)
MSAWYNKTMAFPGELNINYYKGDTHEFKVYPQRADGSVFNLSEYSNATFTIATERGSSPASNVLMPAGRIFGSARINSDHIVCAITPENGAQMDAELLYVYDVQIYSQGSNTYDTVFTLLTGSISVTDDVTQDIGSPNKAIPTYRVVYDNTSATSGVPPLDTNGYLPSQNVFVADSGTLARIGYIFAGWTKFSDGTGTVYTPGSSLPLLSSDIIFYPKWSATSALNTIVWDNQSATTSHIGGSTEYVTGFTIANIPATAPVRTSHVFGGWFTGAAGTGTEVTNNSYTPASPYGPVTIYAKWTSV